MKKILVAITLVGLLLSGCSIFPDPPAPSKMTGLKIIDKHGSRWEHHIMFEKNGDKIEMQTKSDEIYDAVQVGMTVDVTYDDNYFIRSVQFPNLNK